ncbi:MAG: putative aminopeptidase [Ignavibacteria bacterium]|nr:MAG: putative aminopeptidase [Ignavibacteria bacterium]KAF0161009.1 MAG: putative aminopeptidase [Ignavibacteria bacterium]
MKKLIPFLFVISFFLQEVSWGQIFSQDFNSSTNLSDYYNATNPNPGQWNSISTSGVGTTISVATNNLSFARTGNAGSFSRTTDFSPTPTGLIYKFDISVNGNTAAQTTAAVLQVGSDFGTTNSAETIAKTYARIAINFSATSGTFQIRDITNGANSSDFTGTISVTWGLNNTGTTQTYTAPDGSTETLANGKADLWAGTTKIFDDVAVQNTTLTMTDLKFAFTAGTGTITFDNFVIYGASDNLSLPVELTSFTALLADNNVQLNWETATEVNNYGFNVERGSTSLGMTWAKIGFVNGHGNSNSPKRYTFIDNAAPAGNVKYRLKQIDFDGKYEYSDVVEVKVETPTKLVLYQNSPNPFNPETTIQYTIPSNLSADKAGVKGETVNVILKVYDLLGREVATLVDEYKEPGSYKIVFNPASSIKNPASGIYFYRLQAGNYSEVKKMVLNK